MLLVFQTPTYADFRDKKGNFVNRTSISQHCALVVNTSMAAIVAALSSITVCGDAAAQAAPAAQADTTATTAGAEASAPRGAGDIVVTARRKSESILKSPVAIKALTGSDLAARGITTLQDIGNFVPGANVVGQATQGGRADRSFVGVVIRGVTPTTSVSQTSSMFIDGVPIGTATAMQTINNPARVEVLKGPQSATFGRQTFAGAINIVTKDPSNHLTGSIDGMGGSRGNYDASVEVSAPIVGDLNGYGDVLSFRASGRAFGKKGSYRNASIPSQTLGDQSTKSATLTVLFRPTSKLSFKVFGLRTELKDGPSAQGLISAYSYATPSGSPLLIDQSNCTLNGTTGAKPYVCGVAPQLSGITPSANTAVTPQITNYLANGANRVVSPKDGTHAYGLVNHYYHVHLVTKWDLSQSITLQSLTGWDHEQRSSLNDLDNYNGSAVTQTASATNEGYWNYPYLVEGLAKDFSQEFRASFENGGKLHASAGASYLNSTSQSSSGALATGSTLFGMAQNRTFGAFYSLAYDFSPRFTLNFDGRYQIDKVYAYAPPSGVTATTNAFVPAGFYAGGSVLAQKTYRKFLPRVIAQFNLTPNNMFYATYSQGINPAVFNTSFINAVPAVVTAAQALGYQIAIKPEQITNYEIGAKGKLLNNRVRYDLDAYLMIWTNQISNQTQTIISGGVPQQVVANTNAGSVRLSGFEGSVSADLTRKLTLDLSGAYTNSYILTAANSSVTALTGITNYRGKQNAFVSKWSGTAALQYTTPVGAHDLDAYGRIDFTYKSGSYSNIANIVRTPDMNQVNLRLGLRNKTYSLEGFVTNVFNNRAYYSVVDGYALTPDFSHTATSSALVVQLRELRTFGVRAGINF